MRSTLACTLLAFFLLIGPAVAQNAIPPSSWQKVSPQSHAENALKTMVQGNIDGAFKALFGKGHTKEQLDKLKFEFYRIFKKNGNPHGYEKLIDRKAGNSILLLRYVLLFKNQPIMLDFYYYKRPTGWALRTFHFSKNIKEIFKR